MDGWIKLHRKLLSSLVWNTADAEGKVILITLLLRASHAATQWRINGSKTVALNPGQLFITYRTFAVKCGVSVKKITTELLRLESLGFISTKKGRDGTIITICSWDYYQQAETPKGTPMDTPAGTPAKPVPASVPGQNNAPAETPMETPTDTGLETHNKIYILLKNKYNKTDLNNKLLEQAEQHPDYQRALARYAEMFPDKGNALRIEDAYTLKVIAALLGANWIYRAVYELKAAKSEKRIKNPRKYLLGILQNWLLNGMPNDSKGKEQELQDFYREEGII